MDIKFLDKIVPCVMISYNSLQGQRRPHSQKAGVFLF